MINGVASPSPAENEELYTQLLRLRDAVVAGKHASLKLPASAIERLKASLIVPDAPALVSRQSSAINGTAFTTNQTQLHQSPSTPVFGVPAFGHLPGLLASGTPLANGAGPVQVAKPAQTAGLDPIFLEKSESLVRAEGQLKRQRLDRDLQAQVDQRKHSSRDKDPGADAPSPIDIDSVLRVALERVKPVSGLKEADRPGSAASSSFDENDYYSSQVQSDWSSEASSNQQASDKAAGAFTADFEPLEGAPHTSPAFATTRSSQMKEPAVPGSSLPQSSKNRPHVYMNEPEDVYEIEDDDDDYTPPDATTSEGIREEGASIQAGHATPPEDDNSEYEPGEITDNNIPIPQQQPQHITQPSPRVPVIRNHLTHIVAPQPNRVSPLATAKNPSIELELVNGRPEVVQKPQHQLNTIQSRASTASPSGNGVGGSGKKKRNKKRKRDVEPHGRAKRRRERQAVLEAAQTSPTYAEPYIKDEPVSPPPFSNVQDIPPYSQPYVRQVPSDVEIMSQRQAPRVQYVNEAPRPALRYEEMQPQPTVIRVASPYAHQPVQRDNQDLRRVASLHYAQRNTPPPQLPPWSPLPPGPSQASSMIHGNQPVQPRSPQDHGVPRYQEQMPRDASPYVRTERSRSPPRVNEYRSAYGSRAASPPPMPPPAAPPRRIMVDQHGNHYYAADTQPAPTPVSRPSMPTHERRPVTNMANEGSASRTSVSYAQLLPPQSSPYTSSDPRMAPPPPPPQSGRPQQQLPDQRIIHADANGWPVTEYHPRSAEQHHYSELPTSPVYQPVHGYEQQMPPPQPALDQATSPVFVSRSYSTRPEEPAAPPPTYLRHASVAPVQYVRQQPRPPARAASVVPAGVEYAPQPQPQPPQQQRTYSQAAPQARAVSVVPAGVEYAPQQQPRTYSQAPPLAGVRYVDQFGREVFPQEVRQVGGDYR